MDSVYYPVRAVISCYREVSFGALLQLLWHYIDAIRAALDERHRSHGQILSWLCKLRPFRTTWAQTISPMIKAIQLPWRKPNLARQVVGGRFTAAVRHIQNVVQGECERAAIRTGETKHFGRWAENQIYVRLASPWYKLPLRRPLNVVAPLMTGVANAKPKAKAVL
jgi:hypothetical protein